MCVFCNIVNGTIPADIVFENDKNLCFIPKDMEVKGHLVVIPKKHYLDIFEIPAEELSEVIKTVQEMSNLVKEKLGATGVNILNANGVGAQQSVGHFHMHILPRYKGDNLDCWPVLPDCNLDKKEVLKKLV